MTGRHNPMECKMQMQDEKMTDLTERREIEERKNVGHKGE